jgi:hypothetical protein
VTQEGIPGPVSGKGESLGVVSTAGSLREEMTMAIPGITVAGVLRSVLLVCAPLTIVGLRPGTIGNAAEVKPKPITVTGCLQKGTTETSFILTTKRGKKYEVESTALALAGHVGHTVTIKGSFRAEVPEHETAGKESMEKKTGEAKAEAEAGHIDAASLKMVRPTCS